MTSALQMTIDDVLSAGVAAGERAAMRAGPEFTAAADDFLRAFAARADRPFSSEEVVASAAASGLACEEQRAWGWVFMRAARAGIIRRSDQVFRRRFGHGSFGVLWETCR